MSDGPGFKARLRRARRFMTSDIWDVELSSMPKLGRVGARFLRVAHLVFRGFIKDECPLHASALTFSTIMAIVPILALSLALARGFGSEQLARERIRQSVGDWTSTFSSRAAPHAPAADFACDDAAAGGVSNGASPRAEQRGGELALAEEIDRLVDQAFEKVENISFAALGGVGLVLLLWLVVMVLGRVEAAFNRVWGVTNGRPLWRKFTDYLSAVFILPFLLLLATSLPVVQFATRFVNEDVAAQIQTILGSGQLKDVTVFLMTSLTFTFIIMFMPNAKVRFGPGLSGGIVAALLFLAWLAICAAAQTSVSRYGRIYGSFAVVPILLAWVQVSWEIVLFGAEVAFAIQNAETYRMEQSGVTASSEARVLLGLSILRAAAEAMMVRKTEFTVAGYARQHKVPVRLLNSVIDELLALGFVGELSEKTGHLAMLRAPECTTVGEVVEAMLRSGTHPGRLGMGSIEQSVREAVTSAVEGMEGRLSEMTLGDLVRAPAETGAK